MAHGSFGRLQLPLECGRRCLERAERADLAGRAHERIGRQGLAVVDAENVTGLQADPAWARVCVVERRHRDGRRLRDRASHHDRPQHVRRKQLRRGQTWAFGADPHGGDVTVVDNSHTVPTSGCFAPPRVLSPAPPATVRPPVHRSGFVFRGNRLLGTRNGLELRGVRNAEVSSNTYRAPAHRRLRNQGGRAARGLAHRLRHCLQRLQRRELRVQDGHAQHRNHLGRKHLTG